MNGPSNILHTGGAKGGDKQWENLAKAKEHIIKEYHFDGHKHTRTELIEPGAEHKLELVDLTPDEKEEMRISLQHASHNMKIDLKDMDLAARHLLERDWIMIKRSDAKSLYATGHFDHNSRLGIHGGTGWIVELFVDYYLNENCGKLPYSIKPLPVYFKSIDKNAQFNGWFQLCLNGLHKLKWERVDRIPDPIGNWIGVGSRN